MINTKFTPERIGYFNSNFMNLVLKHEFDETEILVKSFLNVL